MNELGAILGGVAVCGEWDRYQVICEICDNIRHMVIINANATGDINIIYSQLGLQEGIETPNQRRVGAGEG